MLHDTILNFGKHLGQSIKQICEQGNYNYLKYIASLDNKAPSSVKDNIKQFVTEMEERLEPVRTSNRAMYKEMYKAAITSIKFYQTKRVLTERTPSNFVTNILVKLENGDALTFNVYDIVATIAAKTKGRGNSNAFKVAYNQHMEVFQKIIDNEKVLLEKINYF